MDKTVLYVKETSALAGEVRDFADMGLRTSLIRGLYAEGFERPSDIQQSAIPLLCEGRDCIFETANGTGRTVAFSTAVLQLVDFSVRKPQAIVLADPHIARYTHRAMKNLALHMNIKIHLVIDGQGQPGMEAHAKMLAEGVHIVVGTPGRIHHLLTETTALQTERVRTLVIRQADDLFHTFGNTQVNGIMGSLPGQPQVCLSTSSAACLLDFVQKFMHDPLFIRVKKVQAFAEINQYFVVVDREEWKLDTLCDLLESLAPSQAVVFCNSRRKVEWVLERMSGSTFPCISVTDEMDAREKSLAVQEFRSGNSRVLITMDLFVRQAIGYELTKLIINYDVPESPPTYINRTVAVGMIGGVRTDCSPRVVINLVAAQDAGRLKRIEDEFHTVLNELPHDLDIWT